MSSVREMILVRFFLVALACLLACLVVLKEIDVDIDCIYCGSHCYTESMLEHIAARFNQRFAHYECSGWEAASH